MKDPNARNGNTVILSLSRVFLATKQSIMLYFLLLKLGMLQLSFQSTVFFLVY